jgi:uncharacterized membrane protein
MSKRILQELDELLDANVISQEAALKIEAYYQSEDDDSNSRLPTIFGILGALLIGLGIILIVANKWEELSKTWKLTASFAPLLIGQLFCAYSLWKRNDSRTWRESSATFLLLAIGASISLISQVYYMPSDLTPYMLTWSLLSLPLVYILQSSVASLLYIIGITIYGCNTGYWTPDFPSSYIYWLLLALIIPFYVWLIRNRPLDNFTIIHHWFIPLSLIICLGSISRGEDVWLFVAYMSLLSLIYMIGDRYLNKAGIVSNGFKTIAIVGMIIMLLILSFDEVWKELANKDYDLSEIIRSGGFIGSVVLSLAALAFFVYRKKWNQSDHLKLPEFIFLLFIPIFILGYWTTVLPLILCNLLVLAYGIMTIKKGVESNHFGLLNFGLLVLAALILSRFFDDIIPFVVRGLLFLLLGAGFFVTNYWLMKKRKRVNQ